MTQFWIYSVLLLVAALLLLLWPILRGIKDQTEEDRTALNIALYEEHIAELEEQHANGALSADQLAEGRLEASRELLDDTDVGRPKQSAKLGTALPLITALMLPVVGLALYFHWGASDKVALTLSLAEQPKTAAEAIQRLEETVRVQPESLDAWYFLGRTYMAEQRPKEAAHAFEKAVELAGRQAELLGQWAQALYFASNNQWNEHIQGLVDEALAQDPNEATSLGLVGIAAFEARRYQDAINAWSRLAQGLDPRDPSFQAIQTGIERARAALAASSGEQVENSQPAESLSTEPAAANAYQLQVEVALSDALVGQVSATDTVYVFARAQDGPPMPLAAKRLTVGDLPARFAMTDADSLMPNLKLSSVQLIELKASISSDGDAMQAQWVSDAVAVDAAEEASHTLLIDQEN